MTTATWNKVFIGFGVLTLISGILLIYEKDYLIGVSGSVVGIFLIYLNVKNAQNLSGK